MRPVNLIPPEDRRGDRAPLRAGAVSYLIVGACVALLLAVVGLVTAQNSITERENEIAQLEVTRDATAQRAAALAPYAEFASLQEQRELTIVSLAQSRFDWERVLRELAKVIPGNVTLGSLTASTAGGAVEVETGSSPSLEMAGCAPSHNHVAVFVAALEDIDGVTRVGLENSTAAGVAVADADESADGTGAVFCGPKSTDFALTAVFDGVDLAGEAAAAAAAVTAPAQPVAAESSTQQQIDKADEAANLVPGVSR